LPTDSEGAFGPAVRPWQGIQKSSIQAGKIMEKANLPDCHQVWSGFDIHAYSAWRR